MHLFVRSLYPKALNPKRSRFSVIRGTQTRDETHHTTPQHARALEAWREREQ
jgi:hypothetical protein